MPSSVRDDEFLLAVPGSMACCSDEKLPTWRDKGQVEAIRQAWQQLIDYRLIEWGSNIEQVDDDGVEPPSRATIAQAISLAQQCQSMGLPAPDNVVPDANGGIVFERREQDVREVIHIWDDGCVEYQRFRGTSLVERRPF